MTLPKPSMHFPYLAICIALLPAAVFAQTTGVTLASSPNPSIFGAPVLLTAALPPGAAGEVTFYDGVTILGTAPASGGSAVLTTSFLPIGTRWLHCYYSGSGNNVASASNVLTQVVNTLPAGSLQSPVNYDVGATPSAIATGDFAGNGNTDLAVANSASNSVSVLLGNRGGTFAPAVNYAVGTGPAAVAVGDFDRDGRIDLAVVNSGNGTVSILPGNGDGTFRPARTVTTGGSPAAVAVGDFNRDGIADLAVANSTSNEVSVLPGKGDGTFGAAIHYAAGEQPVSVAVGDFNQDGYADLVVANETGKDFSILLGKADGTFQDAIHYPISVPGLPSQPVFVTVGDFNSDGIPDLAIVANASDSWVSRISLFFGAGNGTFGSPGVYSRTSKTAGLLTGDFNGDGNLDFATVDQGLTLAFGTGDGNFPETAITPLAAGTTPVAFVAGDFNHDGRTDFAVVDSVSGNVSVLLAGMPPVLSCSPADLSVTIADPAQDVLSEFCEATSTPAGLSLNLSTDPSSTSGAWVTPVLDSTTTPTLMEVYQNGFSGWGPGRHNQSIDLWDAASGYHVRIPANLTISPSVCNYTMTPPSTFAPEYGAAGLITIQSSHGCDTPVISSDSSWLTFQLNPPGFGSTAVAYTVAPNTGPTRRGNLMIGSQAFPVVEFGPVQPSLSPVSVKPANGSGAAQSFQFVFSDVAGPADLSAQIWFTQSPGTDFSATCKLYYVAATNQLHLADDTGLNELTAALGSPGILQNYQCGVDTGSSRSSWSGDTLTLTLSMTFSQAMAGTSPIWMEALGINSGSGWSQRGTWTVPSQPGAVSVVTAKPCCGSGISQTFTFTYADTSGGQQIRNAWVWFTPVFNTATAAGTCQISFNIANSQWNLLNDAGTGWISGSFGTTLQNSQCSFQPNSNFGSNGNQFFWSTTVTFTAGFGGVKQIWMSAAESGGNSSGWHQFGTWTVASRLQIVSLVPANGSGTKQIFQVTLSDPDLSSPYYLKSLDILVNSSLSPVNACYMHIDYSTRAIYLKSDDGTQWLNRPENAQCAVDLTGYHLAGYVATVLVKFKPGFAGTKTVYVAAADTNSSLALQPFGVYTVPAQTPVIPQVVSVQPSSGYGTSYSGTLVFYDGLSIADLASVNVLFSTSSANFAHACSISVNPPAGTYQLANDAGTGWLGPWFAGNLSLPNSQCQVGVLQMNGPLTGNTLTLTLLVTFQPGYSGLTNLYVEANSVSGTSSGWQSLGTWGTYTPVPTIDSVSPSTGSGRTQTFTFTGSYLEGGSQIRLVGMLFGSPGLNHASTNIANTCVVTYNAQLNLIGLVDDSGLYGTSRAPGGGGHLANSQCRLDVADFVATVNGNHLTIQLSVTFSYDYQGTHSLWMSAISNDDNGTVFTQLGSWTVPASPVAFTASPNPAIYGQPVTLSAMLKAGGGTGTVTFSDGSNIVGTGVMVNGTAAFTTVGLPAGNHRLTAYYSGDDKHPATQSATVLESVNSVAWTQLTAVVPAKTGAGPVSVTVGDFNRDHRPDLAVVNQAENSISVLLGNGDGSFRSAATYAAGVGPASIVTGDFNRDGAADLAVGGSSGVSILLGNGDGTFNPAVAYPAGAGGAPCLAMADFNGDGIADLAASGLGTTVILPGNGDGTFATPVPVNVPAALWLAAGDYNSDLDVDLVVGLESGGAVALLPGNGDFSFRGPNLLTLGDTATAGVLADLNGDGKPDLALGTQATDASLLIMTGVGSGILPQYQLSVPVQPTALAVGDFNGDGTADIAVVGPSGAASALDILMGTGAAAFSRPESYPIGSAQAAVAMADFDGDGRIDLALVDSHSDSVQILLGARPSAATPILSIAKTHLGSFLLGQAAAAYTLTVSNGGADTNAAVTVTESLPPGLTLTSMTGSGWTCGKGANTCERDDSLPQGASYPAITVTISVASNASSPAVNQASVSGGGSPVARTSDPATLISPSACDLKIVGTTTISDVQQILNEALGITPPEHDLNHDGAIGVAEAQIVINAALGLRCVTGP